MPNVWTAVNANGFNGWIMDYTLQPSFAGTYRIHRGNLRLERLNPQSQTWSRWDVPPLAVPLTVASLTTGGSVPYNVNFTPDNPAVFDVQSQGSNLHFTLPRRDFQMADAIEHSFFSTRFGSGFQSIGGNLQNHQPIDTSLQVRLPLGSQSSSNIHAGFGIFHILSARGRSVNWSVDELFRVIQGLLSGESYVTYRGRDINGDNEWWIVGKDRVRGLSGGSKDRAWQRWQLVLKEKSNHLVVQTLLTANDSAQFRQDVGIPSTTTL